MSDTFGRLGGIAIHQDIAENLENPANRKTRRDEASGKMPANKRAALGTITNSSRIQPFRAAKLGNFGEVCQNENVQAKGGKPFSAGPQMGFSIHIDGEASQPAFTNLKPTNVLQDNIELNPALLRPLSRDNEILVDSSPISVESPMLLDASMSAHRSEESPAERLNRILTAAEYSEEIYTYLREAEIRNRAKPSYMRKQHDITTSMRSILVDWLVEVAEEYKLHRETLYLSVNYIDRFLSQMSVLRGKLQLVGAASMFIASKYEEIYPPEVGEFVYITDDTYTKKQVLRMEHLILKVLSFDVAVPTINCLCEKFLKDMDADDKTSSLAYYLCELTLVDGETYLKYLPSTIAAAATCLSNHTLGQEAWPAKMAETTKYNVQDFEECLKDLYSTFQSAPSHPQQAIREKYKDRKYQQVSMLTPPPLSAH